MNLKQQEKWFSQMQQDKTLPVGTEDMIRKLLQGFSELGTEIDLDDLRELYHLGLFHESVEITKRNILSLQKVPSRPLLDLLGMTGKRNAQTNFDLLCQALHLQTHASLTTFYEQMKRLMERVSIHDERFNQDVFLLLAQCREEPQLMAIVDLLIVIHEKGLLVPVCFQEILQILTCVIHLRNQHIEMFKQMLSILINTHLFFQEKALQNVQAMVPYLQRVIHERDTLTYDYQFVSKMIFNFSKLEDDKLLTPPKKEMFVQILFDCLLQFHQHASLTKSQFNKNRLMESVMTLYHGGLLGGQRHQIKHNIDSLVVLVTRLSSINALWLMWAACQHKKMNQAWFNHLVEICEIPEVSVEEIIAALLQNLELVIFVFKENNECFKEMLKPLVKFHTDKIIHAKGDFAFVESNPSFYHAFMCHLILSGDEHFNIFIRQYESFKKMVGFNDHEWFNLAVKSANQSAIEELRELPVLNLYARVFEQADIRLFPTHSTLQKTGTGVPHYYRPH